MQRKWTQEQHGKRRSLTQSSEKKEDLGRMPPSPVLIRAGRFRLEFETIDSEHGTRGERVYLLKEKR